MNDPIAPHDGLRDRAHVRAVIASVVLVAIALSVLAIFRIDISPARDFRRDAIVRDGFANEPPPNVRFYDPSPISIWLSFDWFVWDNVRAGNLPIWERLQGGGYSPLVALQAGVFHPLRWIACAFPRDLMPSALIVLALYVAALGWYFFGVTFGLGRLASIAGALLFIFSPPMLSFVHFSGALVPLAHLPWLAFLYRRAIDAPSRWRFLAMAVCVALVLIGGHPLIAFSIFLAVGCLALVDAIVRRSVRPLLLLAGAGVCGVMLAAFALLPVYVAADDMWSYKVGSRAGLAYEPLTWTRYFAALATMMSDGVEPSSYLDTWKYYDGLGSVVVVLIVCGFVSARRNRAVLWLSIIALAWFALTVAGPWMVFIRWVPLLKYLKTWYYSGAFALFYCAVAAAGLAFLLARPQKLLRILGGALAIAGIAIGVARAWYVLMPRPWEPIVRGAITDKLKSFDEPLRITGLWGQVHLPNAARVTGIEDVRISGPFYPKRYRAWWFAVDDAFIRHSYPTVPFTDQLRSPLVDDFNVVFVLQGRMAVTNWFESAMSGKRDKYLAKTVNPPEFVPFLRTNFADLRWNTGARRRANFAETIVTVPTMLDAVQMFREHPELPRQTSVVESTERISVPPRSVGNVRVDYPADSEVVLTTDSPTGGMLVLHDSYAPGWTATLDGRDAMIYPVNVLSRGVLVPPGRHVVRMSYMPPGFKAGVAISIVALFGMIALASLHRVGSRA